MITNHELKGLCVFPTPSSKIVSTNGISWISVLARVKVFPNLKELLDRIGPPKTPTFNIHDIEGIKLLTRLTTDIDTRNRGQ